MGNTATGANSGATIRRSLRCFRCSTDFSTVPYRIRNPCIEHPPSTFFREGYAMPPSSWRSEPSPIYTDLLTYANPFTTVLFRNGVSKWARATFANFSTRWIIEDAVNYKTNLESVFSSHHRYYNTHSQLIGSIKKLSRYANRVYFNLQMLQTFLINHHQSYQEAVRSWSLYTIYYTTSRTWLFP